MCEELSVKELAAACLPSLSVGQEEKYRFRERLFFCNLYFFSDYQTAMFISAELQTNFSYNTEQSQSAHQSSLLLH